MCLILNEPVSCKVRSVNNYVLNTVVLLDTYSIKAFSSDEFFVTYYALYTE